MKNDTNKKYKKYLPSKKFTYLILSFIGIGALIFLISGLFFGKISFTNSKPKDALSVQKMTVDDLLQKDSDGDGVMDWEEGLFGTDPYKIKTFGDMSDAEYIKSKRDALKTPGQSGESTEPNETTKFSQQFFASLAALKQSGQLDKNTLVNMSSSLGEEIANPTLTDAYTEENLKINKTDTNDTEQAYYLKAGNLFETYKEKGVGDELNSVSTMAASGANSQNPESEANLITIADAYQEYATKMLAISVPESLAQYHLDIINSSNNTGISVRNMTKITGDPIVGLSGVAQYQKYSDALVKAVGDLEKQLTDKGVLSQ